MRQKLLILIIISLLILGCAEEIPNEVPIDVPVGEPIDRLTETSPTTEPPEPVEEPAPPLEPEPKEAPEPVVEPVEEPKLVNGKTVEQRLEEAYEILHQEESGQHLRDNFPDIEVIHTDSGEGSFYPAEILPFIYYYSEEANKTFNLCEVDRTIFICDGKLTHTVTEEEMDSGRCVVTPIYRQV